MAADQVTAEQAAEAERSLEEAGVQALAAETAARELLALAEANKEAFLRSLTDGIIARHCPRN